MPGKNTCAIGYLFVTIRYLKYSLALQQQFSVAGNYSTLAEVGTLC